MSNRVPSSTKSHPLLRAASANEYRLSFRERVAFVKLGLDNHDLCPVTVGVLGPYVEVVITPPEVHLGRLR